MWRWVLAGIGFFTGCAAPCEEGPHVSWGTLHMGGVSGDPVTVTGTMTVFATRQTNGTRVSGSSGPDSSYCTYDSEPIEGVLTVERSNGSPLFVEPDPTLAGTYRATLVYAQHFTWTLADDEGEPLTKEWAMPALFTVGALQTSEGLTVSWSGTNGRLRVLSPSLSVIHDSYVGDTASKTFPMSELTEAGSYSISLRRGSDQAMSTPESYSVSISTTFTRP